MRALSANWVVGRTIVAVDLRPHKVTSEGNRMVTMYWPIFTLDNGARISFPIQAHPDSADFGVCPTYHPAPKPND